MLEISKLLVAGDALEDIYLQGSWSIKNGIKRFKPEIELKYKGGAANTFANAQAILGDKAEVLSLMNTNPLKLYRFVSEEPTIEAYLEEATDTSVSLLATEGKRVDGIIISDYNKGTVNNWKVQPYIADWILVDSRYRSVHSNWLQMAKTKIWRCTGDEYDAEWAKQFDYIVHTDGGRKISICNGEGIILKDFAVPQIEPIDTCGAGDTFTAMLGAQLLFREPAPIYWMSKEPIPPEFLMRVYSAMPLCIQAAQDVCMKPRTAITDIRL